MPGRRREHEPKAATTPAEGGMDRDVGDEQDLLGNAFIAERLMAGAPPTGAADAEGGSDPRPMDRKLADLAAGLAAAEAIMADPDETVEGVERELPVIQDEFGMKTLKLVPDGPHRFRPFGQVNPQLLGDGTWLLSDVDISVLNAWIGDLGVPDVHPLVVQLVAGEFRARFGAVTHPLVDEVAELLAGAGPMEGVGDGVVDGAAAAAAAPIEHAAALPDAEMDAPELADDPPAQGQANIAPLLDDAPMHDGGAAAAHNDHGGAAAALQDDGVVEAAPQQQDPMPRIVPAGRPTRQQWTEEENVQLAGVRARIDALRELYFTPPAPDDEQRDAAANLAHAARHAGDIRLVPVGAAEVPPNRLAPFKTDYVFTDQDKNYTIRLLEPGIRGRIPDHAGDTDFEIISVNPPITKTAKGRAYTGDQGYFPNVAFVGADRGAPPTARDAGGGLGSVVAFANAADAVVAGYDAQAATPQDPWVFCVPQGKQDAKQAGEPGLGRRGMTEAAFDETLEEGVPRKDQRSMVTRRPAQQRQEAGRNPQQTADGTPAAVWAGGTRAAGGALASHEYCHLVGDGDGGPCEDHNLVIGTNGVNTEQLALEETLRPYRPTFRRLGWSIMIEVTAIVEQVPMNLQGVNEDVRWPADSLADFIRYKITAMPMDVALEGMHRLPIMTHVMDGKRGTITDMEVELLKRKLTASFDAALQTVQEQIGDTELADEWAGGEAQHLHGDQNAPLAAPQTPVNHPM